VGPVEIRQREADGEVVTLARVYTRESDGAAMIEPTDKANLTMIESILARAGIVDRIGRPIPRSDGEAYLRALPQSLRGSRLWAEEVSGKGG
jgi:hypothetical protein